MNLRQTVFGLTVLVGTSGCGTNPLYTVTAHSAQQSSGIVYALPKTVLTVELDVETATSVQGEYAEYNTALGLPPAEVPADGKPTFKSVRITPLAIPDEANRFVVKPTEHGLTTDRRLQFVFTESGLLTNSEASADNRTADTAVVVLKAAASIVGSAFGFSTIGSAAAAPAASPASREMKDANDALTYEQNDCLGRITKQVGVHSTVAEEARRKEACKAYGRLQMLVQERDRMITKTAAHITADSLRLQLDATTTEIESLERLFFVSVFKKVSAWKLFVDPDTAITCVTLDAKGTPTAKPSATNDACDAKAVQLSIPTGPATKCQANDGIVYRVPKEGAYVASLGGQQLTAGRALFPQFGVCASAPNEVKGDGRVVVDLSPSTGMLTKVSVEGTADYDQVLTATGETATQVLDAGNEAADSRAAKRAAEKTANDPLALKKKELELLEVQRQIDCYETQGQPCSSAAGAPAK